MLVEHRNIWPSAPPLWHFLKRKGLQISHFAWFTTWPNNVPLCHVNSGSSSSHYTIDDTTCSLRIGTKQWSHHLGPCEFFYMFFASYLIQLTYISFISYRFWMKRHQDDGSHSQDHGSTPNHRREQLLAGWEHIQLQSGKRTATHQTKRNNNGMTRRWEMTTSRGCR